MKALIFGAGGQVGRALAKAAPAGISVSALTRTGCEVTDPTAVAETIAAARPDVVVNAAAFTAVDRAEAEPQQAALVNTAAPGWIAAATTDVGARMIHISTDFVFDGRAGTPYRPCDATNPLSVYGRTKRDGDMAVLNASPGALIVRTAWVYASDGANFVHTMLRLMRQRDLLQVVADQIGTPTYAEGLAHAIWDLALSGRSNIHHFTDAGVASWYDFAVAIQEEALAIGLLTRVARIVPIRTEDYPTPAHRPACSVLDKSETWPLLAKPPPHWRVNLRACLREIADNG